MDASFLWFAKLGWKELWRLDELDRCDQARWRFFPGLALTVRARHCGTIGDVPIAIRLDDSRDFVFHGGGIGALWLVAV
jgi:hypothetical protein